MARTDAISNGAGGIQTTITLTGLTLSGVNRLVYIAVNHWLDNGVGTTVDTVTVGGTTIYDLGVETSRQIANLAAASDAAFKTEVFRVFDAALPANGDRDVVITLSAATDSGIAAAAIAYSDADQTTGHRGSPVTFTTEDTSISMAITADGADQEGIAFLCWDGGSGANTVTPTAPTTELLASVGTAASIYVLQRPAGGTPMAATYSADPTRDVGWAASILATGSGVDRDVLIRFGSMLATTGSGLVTAAFLSGAPAAVGSGGLLLWYYQNLVEDTV